MGDDASKTDRVTPEAKELSRPFWRSTLYVFLGWNLAVALGLTIPFIVICWTAGLSFGLKTVGFAHVTSVMAPLVVMILRAWDRTKLRLRMGGLAQTLVIVGVAAATMAVARWENARREAARRHGEETIRRARQEMHAIMRRQRHIDAARVEQYLATVKNGQRDFSELNLLGQGLFLKGYFFPEHTEVLKGFPAVNQDEKVIYTLWQVSGESESASITLVLDPKTGEVLAFNAVKAWRD